MAKILKAYPSPNNKGLTLTPSGAHSDKATTCSSCLDTEVYWGWHRRANKPFLVDKHGYPHGCPAPDTKDVFPGWCEKCPATDLVYLRKKDGFELTESYGLPHACEQSKTISEMKAAKCRFCATQGLYWIVVGGRYSLVQADGIKHLCPNYPVYMKDLKEAVRMNYAFEKAWVNSFPDGHECKKCKGEGHTVFMCKDKRKLKQWGSTEPIEMHRGCKKCKQIGIFNATSRFMYLKNLRKKYWPYQHGYHKWKKHTLP
jgi:hypothetical protein